MGQSLKNRFNGSSQEVVDYARKFDIWAAMEKYGVKDYVAMRTFLKEMAPEEDFHTPQIEISPFGSVDAFDRLLEAILHKYDSLQTVIRDQATKIHQLENELKTYRDNRRDHAAVLVKSVLNYCQE